eukprot:7053500-Lingulodinium_polyedra.AAC.1
MLRLMCCPPSFGRRVVAGTAGPRRGQRSDLRGLPTEAKVCRLSSPLPLRVSSARTYALGPP